MNTPKVLIGDIFQSSSKTLVNTVNCVGVMGKGIAAEFKKKYPEMFVQYKVECKKNEIQPGIPKIYKDLFENSIINFPTKKHWKSPSLFKDIENGLNIFLKKYKEWNIESVAFPPLGCGNGGLSWDIIGPLMYEKLSKIDIPVEIYAPFGTSAEKLKVEFLKNEKLSVQKKGTILQQKITSGNFSSLVVLDRLEKQKYTNSVGRTIFQKIGYILTELGVKTGLSFSKGTYGPYSESFTKEVQYAFANANLIQEVQTGNMIKIKVGENYDKYLKKFTNEIDKIEKKISQTVDLFSRIKNTEQAEEVTTVIYTVKDLKKKQTLVSEEDIIKYISSWKKAWEKEPKKKSVMETIRNLESLGWISLQH